MWESPDRSATGRIRSRYRPAHSLREPLIGGRQSLFERYLGCPTEHRLRLVDVHKGFLLLARPMRGKLHRHVAPHRALQLPSDVEDARTDAGTDVERAGIEPSLLDRKSTRLNSSHVSISY